MAPSKEMPIIVLCCIVIFPVVECHCLVIEVIVWACLRKEDNDWVKKCMEYEVEGARPKGRPKKTWRDCGKDCQALGLNSEDAMDHSR